MWGGRCWEVAVGSPQTQGCGGGVSPVGFGVAPADSQLGHGGDQGRGWGCWEGLVLGEAAGGGAAAPSHTPPLRFGELVTETS